MMRKGDMKIVAIMGSYRRNGNTARVVGLIEAQLHKLAARHSQPLEIERVYLGQQDIGLCRGCRTCFDRGETKCPLKDDLLAIKAKMDEADGILVASPVYMNGLNGITKNWIDRMAFLSHRPEYAGKSAAIVATVGIGPTKYALKILNMALSCWGFHVVGQAGFKTGALMPGEEIEARYRGETDRIAESFFQAIHNRRLAKPSFLSLMTFKIQQLYWQRATDDSIDYAYWKSRGWTEPQREFYIRHEANPLKVALARFAGRIVARYVT